jgi:hypothetical protein
VVRLSLNIDFASKKKAIDACPQCGCPTSAKDFILEWLNVSQIDGENDLEPAKVFREKPDPERIQGLEGREHEIAGRRMLRGPRLELPDISLTGEPPHDRNDIFDVSLRGGSLGSDLGRREPRLQVGFGHGSEGFGERDALAVQSVRPLADEKTAFVQGIAHIVGLEDHVRAAGEMRPGDIGWIEGMHGQLLAVILEKQRL